MIFAIFFEYYHKSCDVLVDTNISVNISDNLYWFERSGRNPKRLNIAAGIAEVTSRAEPAVLGVQLAFR